VTVADIVRDPSPVVRAVRLAERLENLTIIIAGRQIKLTLDPVTGNAVLDLRNLNSSGTPENTTIPVGEDGQVLIADSSEPDGVRWI
jgi:hypothetical protein